MSKICTNISQSKKFIELGIDVNTADMWWAERYKGYTTMDYKYIIDDTPYYYLSLTKPSNDNYSQDTINDIPAWSLTALISILPKSARLERGSSTDLCCVNLPVELKCSDWYLDPIDAAFEIVCWLLENKML